MVERFLIISLFVLLSAATVSVLYTGRKRPIGFIDGALVGLLFFLTIPMSIILITGSLSNRGILAPSYLPYEDLKTTTTIYIGWISVLVASLLCRGKWNVIPKTPFPAKMYDRIVYVVLILYFVFSVYSLMRSGFGTVGNHWHKSVSSTFSQSSLFLITKNFSASLRVMAFGALWTWQNQGRVTPKKAILWGGLLTFFDVITTFNRITIVFYALMILFIYGRRAIWPAVSMMLLAPLVSALSSAWPYFRSNLFNGGLSFASISQTWQTAIQIASVEATSIDRKLNSLFEASNFIILNYIVNNAPKTCDHFWGYTAIIRPFTTFLPSTFWPGKPKVFGTYMGMEINSQKGLALNSTLFGEAVANFPFLWPAYLIFFLVLMDRLYLMGSRYVPGLYAMGFFVAVALWRFDMNFASIGLYTAILLMIGLVLWGRLPKISSRNK